MFFIKVKNIIKASIAYILYILNVRILPVIHINAIGHLAIEPDCYVKEEILGLHPKYRTIILAPYSQVANHCLLDYWSKYFYIITNPLLCSLLHPFLWQKKIMYDINNYAMNVKDTARIYEINSKWHDREPLLSLSKSHRQRGQQCLRELGLPENAWFVCVHCREPGNRIQDSGHTSRDADINSYILAMEAIVENGGWCIRMGDIFMKPLPKMKNVIDYCHTNIKSNWMDVYLCASCKFVLGCNSGFTCLANIYGVPCAMANSIPMSHIAVTSLDITIPKLLWSKYKSRYLTFNEIFNSAMAECEYFITHSYEKDGIKIIDNTPEDIRDLSIEMFNVTNNTMIYSDEDMRLQEKFKSLIRPGHYCYGSSSRIGRDFLRKYVNLLFD